ncbi:hypothetical protein ACOSQ3_020374 [Xanthoceras sorbifolium]
MKYVKPLQLYHQFAKDVVKRKDPSEFRGLLGLHVDNKYVRVAVTNTVMRFDERKRTIITAKSVNVLPRIFTIDSMTKLLTLIKHVRAIGFVFSHPDIKLMDISDGAHPKFFIDYLRKTGKFKGLKYTYWNMAFMSKQTDFVLKHHLRFISEQLNLPAAVSVEILQKFAAANVLQDYLNYSDLMVETDEK